MLCDAINARGARNFELQLPSATFKGTVSQDFFVSDVFINVSSDPVQHHQPRFRLRFYIPGAMQILT
jgi:hypothetical protein